MSVSGEMILAKEAGKISVPIAAAAEMAQLAIFIKDVIRVKCLEHRQNVRDESGNDEANPSPPNYILPWVKEFRQCLRDVGDLAAMASQDGGSSINIKDYAELYNTMKEELSPATRAELARLEQKKLLENASK